MATVLAREKAARPERTDSDRDEKSGADASTLSVNSIPPLGVAKEERRFFFQRARAYDPDAIATQVRCSSESNRLWKLTQRPIDSPVFSMTQKRPTSTSRGRTG